MAKTDASVMERDENGYKSIDENGYEWNTLINLD